MAKETKILTKENGSQDEYLGDLTGGITMSFKKFISKETVMEDGEKVPKYEILIDPKHPKLKEIEENKIDFWDWNRNSVADENYSYEMSFVDSKNLLKKSQGGQVRKEDNRKRIFGGLNPSNITIKDNSYSEKIKQLKNQTNLMREEEAQWKRFIDDFRQKVSQVEDKNSTKYKEGKKFIEELEAELNKKTGKGSDDDDRERERERDKKIEKLRRKIAKLEAIVNRTPAQEQELKDKKKELADLEQEKQQSQEPNKTNWTPWLIGGGIILFLVIGIVAYFWGKVGKEKDNK